MVSFFKRNRKALILGVIAILVIVFYISATFADTPTSKVYDITLTYDVPQVSVNQNGYSELKMKRNGADTYLTSATAGLGAPVLPVDAMILYLKEGETIKNVTVTGQTNQTLSLDKAMQYIVPSQKSDELTSGNAGAPDPAIYNSANFYPGVTLEKNTIQYYRGYRLAFIPVHPVQYNPAGKLLQSATSLSFRVETQIQPGVTPQSKIKPKKNHEQEIRNMIDNKDALNDSLPEKISKIFANSYSQAYADTTPYEYVIIGPKAFENACQGLLNLRRGQGFSGTYLPVETIFSSYSGVDPQEKIRTCLIDYCNNHDTEYVLLVGDTDLVPIRPIMVSVDPNFKKKTNLGKEVYSSAPSDLYYSSLDGTFNYDNDDVWGEVTDGDGGGPIDMFPDLCIGRISAGSVREVNRHIWKIMQYELQPQSQNVLCIGEKLSDSDWGSEYLNTVYNNTLDKVSGYSQTQLQDKTATYTDVDVVNAYNSNTHELIFNHQHANPWGVAKLWWGHFVPDSGATQVTNTHPFFFFSGGCSTNCFKEYDSISEYYTAKSLSGAYAYIGHTSSGRFQQSMDYLQLMVSKNLAATSSNARREKCLGQLLNKAKVEIVNGHTGDFNSYSDYRELHYNLNLLGDPLSPMIKTGFTDLPTNANILPNVQESTNIKFSAPYEETVIAQGKSVTINAVNTDSAVTVTSVTFYYQELKGTAGFQTLNTDSAAPYSYTWNSPPTGDYLLKVEAFNGTTKVGEDTRFFRVAQEVKPVITDIRFPAENPEYRVGQPIFVCAKATDSDGWIEGISYEFKYNDGSATPINESPRINVFPHIGVISAKQPKGSSTHTLEATAKAYDNHGFESAVSTKISFSFNVVEYNPPTISITAPTNGQKLNIKEKVDISIQVYDPKNWKDEDGGIGNVNVKVKRLLDGKVQDLGTKNDLGKSATPTFDFTPTVASDYTITATVTDYDGITKETSVTVKVINPNAPLSFENPSKPWSPVSTNVTLGTDTTLKTEGDSSMVLEGTHYMEFQSAVFSSTDIDYYSNEMSLDVYVPSPLTDSYIGIVQLYFTAPGIYRNHEWIAQFDMKDFTPGQWNTAKFTLPSWVVDVLKGNYNDLVLGMTLNTNQASYFRIDNLRFTGGIVTK